MATWNFGYVGIRKNNILIFECIAYISNKNLILSKTN